MIGLKYKFWMHRKVFIKVDVIIVKIMFIIHKLLIRNSFNKRKFEGFYFINERVARINVQIRIDIRGYLILK